MTLQGFLQRPDSRLGFLKRRNVGRKRKKKVKIPRERCRVLFLWLLALGGVWNLERKERLGKHPNLEINGPRRVCVT